MNFLAFEKFEGDLPVNEAGEQPTPKRRESVTPKIVEVPPIEEMTESIQTPHGGRLLRAISQRRRHNDSVSIAISSSNESLSEEPGSSDDRSDRHRRHRYSGSLRRAFRSLSLSSCIPTDRTCPQKKQQKLKSILRPPVTYTYIRGLSGLPTQRVPRHIAYYSTGRNR